MIFIGVYASNKSLISFDEFIEIVENKNIFKASKVLHHNSIFLDIIKESTINGKLLTPIQYSVLMATSIINNYKKYYLSNVISTDVLLLNININEIQIDKNYLFDLCNINDNSIFILKFSFNDNIYEYEINLIEGGIIRTVCISEYYSDIQSAINKFAIDVFCKINDLVGIK